MSEENFAQLFEEQFKKSRLKDVDKGQKQFGDPDQAYLDSKQTFTPKEVQGVLDLHGLTVERSQWAVRNFIDECRKSNWKKVRIICGMGRNSADGKSKLRPAAVAILNELREKSLIKDYQSAEPRNGGYGALEVMIK